MTTEVYNYNQCMTELEIKAWDNELFNAEHELHIPLTEWLIYGEWYNNRLRPSPRIPPHCAPAG
jgi:hypothetical protein